jgi:hypothetical protein
MLYAIASVLHAANKGSIPTDPVLIASAEKNNDGNKTRL